MRGAMHSARAVLTCWHEAKAQLQKALMLGMAPVCQVTWTQIQYREAEQTPCYCVTLAGVDRALGGVFQLRPGTQAGLNLLYH